MEAIQQQLQLIMEQIRRLNEANDAASTRLGGWEDLCAAVTSLHGRVDILGLASGGGREKPERKFNLIDPKELKVREFEGEQKEFRNFLEDTKAYFEIVDPELGELVDWIELQPSVVRVADAEVEFGETDRKARKLHGWLRHKFRGLARIWVKDKNSADGIQTWRDMLAKYDPMTGASHVDLQRKIMLVRRAKTMAEVPNLVDKFEADYRRFKVRVQKELDDVTLQNIMLEILPAAWEDKLRFNMTTRERQTTYPTLRQEILDLAVNLSGSRTTATSMDVDYLKEMKQLEHLMTIARERRDYRETQGHDRPEESDDEDAEALDALRKGGGKKGGGKKGGKKGGGRDGDKPRVPCPICKKMGHDETGCWCNPKSKWFKGPDYAKKNLNLKALEEADEDEDEEPTRGLGGLDLACMEECDECDNIIADDAWSGVAEDSESDLDSDVDSSACRCLGMKNECVGSGSDPFQSSDGDPWQQQSSMPAIPLSWNSVAYKKAKHEVTKTKHVPFGQEFERQMKEIMNNHEKVEVNADEVDALAPEATLVDAIASEENLSAVADNTCLEPVRQATEMEGGTVQLTGPTLAPVRRATVSVSPPSMAKDFDDTWNALMAKLGTPDGGDSKGKLVSIAPTAAESNEQYDNGSPGRKSGGRRLSTSLKTDDRWTPPANLRSEEAVRSPITPQMFFDTDSNDVVVKFNRAAVADVLTDSKNAESSDELGQSIGVPHFHLDTPNVPPDDSFWSPGRGCSSLLTMPARGETPWIDRADRAEIGVQTVVSMADKDLMKLMDEHAQRPELDPEVFVHEGDMCKSLGVNDAVKPNGKEVSLLKTKVLDENGFAKIQHGITSDSGASDTVAPEEFFSDYPLEPSHGSTNNIWYMGAGGQKIRNMGQRKILLLTREKSLRWLTVQVAAVKKMLGSVSKNNDCGHEVIYRKTGSFIKDEATGEKIHLTREKGTFKYDAWVVPFKIARTGEVSFVDKAGKHKKVNVNAPAGFSRQG